MKLSPIDSRLAARSHQQQIALLRHTDAICAQIVRVYERLIGRLVSAAANGHPGLLGGVHSACAQAKAEAYHVLESQFPALIRQQHRAAVDNLMRTVPLKWWRVLLHPRRMREEWIDVGNGCSYPRTPTACWLGVLQERAEDDKQRVEEMLFPPLSSEQVGEILTSPGHGGLSWQERFQRYVPADQDAIYQELQSGIAAGEDIRNLRKRMETIVAGPSYKAQRIARTEGTRVASAGAKESYAGMEGMIEGWQRICVIDKDSRPDHAKNQGKVYHYDGNGDINDDRSFVAKGGEVFPGDHYEPNCRCDHTVVLKTPEEFQSDPRVAAEFETAQGQSIPDPAAYTEWWTSASEQSHREAVGVRRYQTVDNRLPDGIDPEWIDFIDEDGQLLSPKQLKAETHEQREKRKLAVRRMLQERERLYGEIEV